MRSAWVRALHESPEDAERLCAAQEAAKKRLLRHHSEGACPTDRGLRSRGPPFPRAPAPRAPAQLGRLPEDLRLPYIVVSAKLSKSRGMAFIVNTPLGFQPTHRATNLSQAEQERKKED